MSSAELVEMHEFGQDALSWAELTMNILAKVYKMKIGYFILITITTAEFRFMLL